MRNGGVCATGNRDESMMWKVKELFLGLFVDDELPSVIDLIEVAARGRGNGRFFEIPILRFGGESPQQAIQFKLVLIGLSACC